MAQDPSELESYSLSDPELEHENERDNFSDEGQGEAETTQKPSTLTFQGGAVKKFVC